MSNSQVKMAEPSFLAEMLRGVHLGTVTVFGVLVPGIWCWTSLYLYFMSLTDEATIAHLSKIPLLTGQPLVLWIIGFALVYVVGCVLRASSPDSIDRWSIRYVHSWLCGNERPWRIARGDRYPYESLPEYFRSMGLEGFAKYVPWHRSSGRRSTLWVNTSKIWISFRNSELGDILWSEEAFIRGLSGVARAVASSTSIAIAYLVFNLVRQQFSGSGWEYNPRSVEAGVLTLLANVCVWVGIVANFHRQRLRELSKLVAVMYVLKHNDDDPPYFVLDPLEQPGDET